MRCPDPVKSPYKKAYKTLHFKYSVLNLAIECWNTRIVYFNTGLVTELWNNRKENNKNKYRRVGGEKTRKRGERLQETYKGRKKKEERKK
jgi:hypothetical protein